MRMETLNRAGRGGVGALIVTKRQMRGGVVYAALIQVQRYEH